MPDTFPALHPRLNWDRRKRYLDQALTSAPAAYWRLGEASGTIVYDRAGGFIGTYAGGPTLGVAGALAEDTDTATTFNGSSQYVRVNSGTILNAATDMTLAFWMNCSAQATNNRTLFLDASGKIACYFTLDGATAGLYGRLGGTADDYLMQGTTMTGGWKFVVLTVNAVGVRTAHLDGIPQVCANSTGHTDRKSVV
jgi:hypothetical protein